MILLDSNVLLRYVSPNDPQHVLVSTALSRLLAANDTPCVVPQNFYEFWVVATRPIASNGLDQTIPEVQKHFTRFRSMFRWLPDSPTLFDEWEAIVASFQVKGKPGHDARLIAAMRTHGVSRLLTLNVQDFARFPGIAAVHPASI